MKRSYSVKLRRFLVKYLEREPLYVCAEYAGCKGKDRASLSQMGSQLLQSLNLSMPEICDLTGLTDSYLAGKTLDGLQAKKVEIATYKGKICDTQAFPDYSTRAKYVEIGARLKGLFVDKTELTGRAGGEIELVIIPSQGKKAKRIDLDL